jgi:hypothetical protein
MNDFGMRGTGLWTARNGTGIFRMKVLITALALVTLIASPTFAQRQYPGEFYPADACQSGQNEYCDYPGGPVWHCWEDVRCSAR